MDYARFNYIAQPGDRGVRFILGPYDHYAVVGLPRNSKLGTQAEVPTLDKWILEKQRSNV
jgi:hypothetical protein